jgi:hypothetical protein
MFTIKELAQQRSYRVKSYRVKSNIGERADLPEELDNLIDNKMYRNKYRKMIKDGYLKQLLQLAEIAQSKDKPSHWFAKRCKKSLWESTLKWLGKLSSVKRDAVQIIQRLNVPKEHYNAVYKACWKRKDALRQAITAEEIGIDKLKLFNWLVWRT